MTDKDGNNNALFDELQELSKSPLNPKQQYVLRSMLGLVRRIKDDTNGAATSGTYEPADSKKIERILEYKITPPMIVQHEDIAAAVWSDKQSETPVTLRIVRDEG